jgi:hypothetical protein
MRKVRIGLFETNSSNTHTLTIVSKKAFDAWMSGEVYYNTWNNKILTEEDAIEDSKSTNFYNGNYDEYKADALRSYEAWTKDEYLERFVEHHTTESGDEIVVFGSFGYDG